MIVTPPLSILEAKALSLAELSLHSRRALEEQRTPEMLAKSFTWQESKPVRAWPIQEGRQLMGMVSNVCKAGTHRIDLSTAVEQGTGDGDVLYSVAYIIILS